MGSTHTGFDSDGMTEEKTLKAQARHTCGWSAVLCRRLADDLGDDRVLHLIEYLSDGVHALRDLP